MLRAVTNWSIVSIYKTKIERGDIPLLLLHLFFGDQNCFAWGEWCLIDHSTLVLCPLTIVLFSTLQHLRKTNALTHTHTHSPLSWSVMSFIQVCQTRILIILFTYQNTKSFLFCFVRYDVSAPQGVEFFFSVHTHITSSRRVEREMTQSNQEFLINKNILMIRKKKKKTKP